MCSETEIDGRLDEMPFAIGTIQRHVHELMRMGKRGELDLTDLQRARLRSFSNDIADLVADLEALEAAEPIRSYLSPRENMQVYWAEIERGTR
jgi:hypothetical protein